MILVANILEGAALLAAGALLCWGFLWWKDRNLKKARILQAETILTQARNESEMLLRNARLAASEEALKLREELEKSFAVRRAERAELEGRLSERETLINSQLQRIVEAEESLSHQKETLRKRMADVESQHRELAELSRQRFQQLQNLAG